MNTQNIITLALLAGVSLPAMAQYDIIDSVALKDQQIEVGAFRTFSRENSAAAVTVITNKDVNRRGGRNIGNDLIGQGGNGLLSLQGGGLYNAASPTFYVRGLQSLNGSSPLVLVDGVPRDIANVIAEDVESVQILKDAAAATIYGFKVDDNAGNAANGVILIKTKHGTYNSKSIRFSYDHEFQLMSERPQFVDAATYASAVNEAYRNQGGSAVYSDDVISAYANGSNPTYYPNVNWLDETFRKVAHMNRYDIEFKGGSKNIRYYTNVNLLTSYGYIKNYNTSGGDYSTQNKYTRATLRSNMDIDLTPTTQMHTHIYGVLTEQSQPGSQADLWTMVYKVPANAFPIQTADGVWGGNSVYTTSNPVAQSSQAAYYKNHQRALYADFSIDQDLASVTEGLKASVQLGYDTHSNLYEDHSKTYVYGYYAAETNRVSTPGSVSITTDGQNSNMGTGANNNSWVRRFFANANVTYDRSFGRSDVFGQLNYDFQYNDATGTNTTVYRQNLSLLANYVYDKRYTAQLTLTESGSSRLAPGSKWAFMPAAALSWNVSNESFMDDVEWIDFLKVRASAGLQQLDVLPGSSVWTYYDTFYTMASSVYAFYDYGSDYPNTYITQAKTESLGREKAMKFNVGIDATLLKGLNVSLDYFRQNRYDIWVSTAGSYSDVFALTAPYENRGKMLSQGIEASLDYSHQLGGVTFNVGATFLYDKNKIKEQAEAPQLYANTSSTGLPYGQAFGYETCGFFQKSDAQNGDGIISTAEMDALGYPEQTFTTVYPGDLRYVDVNGDGKIDTNDRKALGYSTTAPEIQYTFHLGAEWKGLGIDAQFQGVAHYTGFMTTNGLYRSAVASNTLSQYLYENSWSSERGNTQNALFPRLSPTSNANNDTNNTLNQYDRSYFKLRNVELYYHLPKSLYRTDVISGIKVYVRGTDLFTFDNLDERDAANTAYQPLSKNIQLGASITF